MYLVAENEQINQEVLVPCILLYRLSLHNPMKRKSFLFGLFIIQQNATTTDSQPE